MGERELLGIVEGIKAFEGILRGQDLTIHTDHLNLLYDKNPTQRMIRWRLMLEEYHPKVLHVAGKENDAADALSRLDMADNDSDEVSWEDPLPALTYHDEVQARLNLLFPLAAEKELEPSTKFPLAPDLIRYYQQQATEPPPKAGVTTGKEVVEFREKKH